ncbi:MAG: hypothetical protein IJY74_05155, partial [Oscillospiraceae bacterium]|nr:hypothetical protein [Oscillospiraceae bacterium]
MNRKFKNALKSAFSIPEPQRKDDFFQSIEENKKAVPFWIPLLKYGAVTAAAAIAIIISSNFTDISNVKEQYVEEAPAVTCVTDENVFDAEELVPENNNPVTVTSSHTHSENLAADSETLTTAPVTAPSNIQTEIHTGITTAVTSSAQTTVSGENSSVTAAATITTATTITTASASKTTPTRAGTYTTVNSVSTAKRTTTSAIPTDPAPSTYTTMPTMTTPSYEPSYTMTTSGPMVDEPSDIGIDYTVYPDSSFYITDNIIDVSEYINFEYSPSPDDNISSELETW